MPKQLLYLLITLLFVFTHTLWAKQYTSSIEKTNTIELFTSEGCSSCPPADEWVSTFVDNKALFKSIIPLVFHIDYWDYIGWKDTFATRNNTSRQRRFQLEGISSSVYTPQFIVNNQEWKGWFTLFGRNKWPMSNEQVGILQLNHTPKSKKLDVTFTPVKKDHKLFKLHVALLGIGIKSHVKRGENQGKSLIHDFIVLSHESYSLKQANYPHTLWTVNMPQVPDFTQNRTALVVWVSEERSQKVIQITGGYLN